MVAGSGRAQAFAAQAMRHAGAHKKLATQKPPEKEKSQSFPTGFFQ
jgi:methionine-rich copper-binding protein CopC